MTPEYIASDAFLRTKRWRKFARSVMRRDGYECRKCARFGRHTGDNLIVHHVKPRDEYPELVFSPENCVTLCRRCHNAEHPEKGGASWR